MFIRKINKRISIGLLVLVLGLILSYKIYDNRLLRVELTVDGEARTVYHREMKVEDLLKEEDVNLQLCPYINEDMDSLIENDMNIIVVNPNKYTVKFKDSFTTVHSFSKNLREIAGEAGFILDHDDYTEPLNYDEMVNGVFEIFKVGKIIEKIETEVPYQTINRDNQNLEEGKTKISQAGEDGLKEETFEVLIVNGVRVEKYSLGEKFLKEPINEVIENGKKAKLVASRSKNPVNPKRIKDIPGTGTVGADGVLSDGTSYKKAIVMRSTAYNNSPEQNGGYTKTALGTPLKRGVVAVDPNVIPLGSRLYIESLDGSPDYGYARAEDRGSAVKGNKIDLCFGSESTKGYGVRNVKVYVLD